MTEEKISRASAKLDFEGNSLKRKDYVRSEEVRQNIKNQVWCGEGAK